MHDRLARRLTLAAALSNPLVWAAAVLAAGLAMCALSALLLYGIYCYLRDELAAPEPPPDTQTEAGMDHQPDTENRPVTQTGAGMDHQPDTADPRPARRRTRETPALAAHAPPPDHARPAPKTAKKATRKRRTKVN